MQKFSALRVFIRTYGCQMNERDSEATLAMLIEHGCVVAESEEEADILIFNTCSVRDQAERKALGKLGIIKKLKRKNPTMLIGVMGCMAQSRGEEILKTLPHIDFVIGTDQLHKITEVITKQLEKREQLLYTKMDDPEILTAMSSHLSNHAEAQRLSASVAISRGCSRFCSYCIVPFVRGPEKSRSKADILKEVQSLVKSGIRDLMLLGQNVATYGVDNTQPPLTPNHSPFADLLEELHAIPELFRINFISPHPAYFNTKLIDTIARLPKISRFIHLPLQSGSDRILKLMNRPYTQEYYMRLVDEIRTKIPDVMFSTDIIVGFPDETDADFEQTRKIMEFTSFDNAYIFKYSPRKDTKAALMPNQISQAVKDERNQILLADLKRLGAAHNNTFLNKVVEVLVEGPSKRNEARWAGKTIANKVTIFNPNSTTKVGDKVIIHVSRVTPTTLYGELVE